jgi:hypothetical protein
MVDSHHPRKSGFFMSRDFPANQLVLICSKMFVYRDGPRGLVLNLDGFVLVCVVEPGGFSCCDFSTFSFPRCTTASNFLN